MIRKMIDLRRFIAWEAIATGIGALGASAINAASQARTNAQNRRQADLAWQREQQAIREQNSYNTPAQQVLRMKAAGLNPSLAYGADGQMVGNQSEIPAYNPIPAEAPQVQSLGIQEATQTALDYRDLERREALATAEIVSKDYQNFLAYCSAEEKQATTQETLRLLGYREQEYESKIELNWENVLKTREEIANLKEERKEIRSRIGVNEEQVKLLSSQVGLTEAETYAILAKLPHEIMQMDANAAYAWAQEAVGRQEVLKISRETAHIGFVERANMRDFDFEKERTVAELKMEWRDQNFSLARGVMSTIGVITGVAAMRNNQPMPRVSGVPALTGNRVRVSSQPSGSRSSRNTGVRAPTGNRGRR